MKDKSFELTNVLPDSLLEDDVDVNKPLPGLPMSLPGLNHSPDENQSTMQYVPKNFMPDEGIPNTFSTGGIPYESTLKNKPEKPGWFEQVGHDLLKYNTTVQAGELLYNSITQNPGVDIVPEGWSVKPEDYENFPQKFYGYIHDSKGPNDLAARKDHLTKQMADDERFENGSLTQNLISGIGGFATDPISYFMPYAVGLKYAKISQNVFMNMGRTAGGIALDSVTRNMLVQANREGGNLQDAVTDSMVDFMFGSALIGAGATVTGGLRNAQLWNMRKTVQFTGAGVNINPVVKSVDGKDIITRYRGEMAPGYAMNAQLVSAANHYIDESMKMGGAFALPYVGQGLSKFLAWGPFASPVLKAAKSPYKAVQRFFNGITSHGIITEGEAKGIARGDSASDYAEQYTDEAKGLTDYIRGQFLSANGIEGGTGVKNSLELMRQTITKGKTISEEDFGKEVRSIAYTEGYKSEYSQAHAVADNLLKFYEKMGIDYHNAIGEGSEFLDPRSSWKYLPQNYNIPAMINDEEGFVSTTVNAIHTQDQQIVALQKPVQDAANYIDLVKTQLKASTNPAQKKILENELKQAQRNHFRLENEQVRLIKENPDHHILLEDRILFDEQERAQLNSILDPIRDAERLKVVAEARLKPLAKERKIRPEDEGVKTKHAKAVEDLEKAEQEIINQQRELERKAANGEIDRKYFTFDNESEGGIKFRDPNKRPVFRDVFESMAHIESHARQTYEKILSQSPMDLLQNVLGTASPGIIEAPGYLKARTTLINSEVYNRAGFLDPDISKSVTAYAGTMGKIIGFKKAFPEFATGKNFEGVLRFFKSEHEERKKLVMDKAPSATRTKELNQLQKEYTDAEKFMKDTYNVFMGTYSSKNPELHRWTTSLKNLTVSAKLGAVPIYQIAELGSIILKQGLMPFLAHGLKPLIQTLNGKLAGKEGEAFRANAANAHIGIYNVQNGYTQKIVNAGSMSHAPFRTAAEKFGIATDNVAHISGNLFGINAIANMNEGIMANTFQSEVMQAAFAHKNGTITLKQRQKMARYGIQIETDGPKFIKGYEESGGWEIAGGFQSNYFNWADSDASNRMALSMRRAVKDTVLNANVFASPYWAQNPIPGMIFMFHGWAYNALNHYTIPFLQRPDAEAMLGIVSIVGLSMLAEPLLRLANGKEAIDDDEKWFERAFKALDYSGLVGPYANQFQSLNAGFGNLVPGLQTERAKNFGTGIVGGGGPVAGYMNDLASSVGHFVKWDWTENDAKKFGRLAPFSSAIPLRRLMKNFIESFNLPQSRKGAESAEWYKILTGE